jgi:hypothetical protein
MHLRHVLRRVSIKSSSNSAPAVQAYLHKCYGKTKTLPHTSSGERMCACMFTTHSAYHPDPPEHQARPINSSAVRCTYHVSFLNIHLSLSLSLIALFRSLSLPCSLSGKESFATRVVILSFYHSQIAVFLPSQVVRRCECKCGND